MLLRIVFFGNGPRGVACLHRILDAGHQVCAVVAHADETSAGRIMKHAACAANLECLAPVDPNRTDFIALLSSKHADVFVLAGYSQIVSNELINTPKMMTINTHAGELPAMRGSSPLNWALIEGRTTVTLSIIQVTSVLDGGDVLAERVCHVNGTTTIADLQNESNRHFPDLLVEVLGALGSGTIRKRQQDNAGRGYYPLRFPDDGFVLWDQLTAEQVHNRIRALTDPYPGAFTFGRNRRIRLLRSEHTITPYMGEPGRVYRKSNRGLLICAADRCLWITHAVDARSGDAASTFIERYDNLATMREAAMRFYQAGVST